MTAATSDADITDIDPDFSSGAVLGNMIGSDRTGTRAFPNEDGLLVGNATIGGLAAGSGNLISGNNGSGISVYDVAHAGVIERNLIGGGRSIEAPLPNIGAAVDVQDEMTPTTDIGPAEPTLRSVGITPQVVFEQSVVTMDEDGIFVGTGDPNKFSA